jgi:hypothetical protein
MENIFIVIGLFIAFLGVLIWRLKVVSTNGPVRKEALSFLLASHYVPNLS